MPVETVYDTWRITKYDPFGRNGVELESKYINTIDSIEIDYARRSLTATLTADANKLGVGQFDIVEIDVRALGSSTAPKVIYRGQAITLGNKKDTGLTNFTFVGLEDSLKYIKPDSNDYGSDGLDVAQLVRLIFISLLGIVDLTNSTTMYTSLYRSNTSKIINTGLIVDRLTLITESYWDLFEYCKNLTGDLNYEWGIDLEREFFFKPIAGVDTLQIDEEISVSWKELNCASHVNTVDFYFPTNDDALTYRVVDTTALDLNGNLKYPERRKTYLLSFEDLVTELTLGTQYLAGNLVPQISPNPLISTLDVLYNTQASYTLSDETTGSTINYLVEYPKLGEFVTDLKAKTYFASFYFGNPIAPNYAQWGWNLTLPKQVIGYKAHITFDSNATGPLTYPPSTLPYQVDLLPYFSVNFERKGDILNKTAYVEYTHGTAGGVKIKKSPLPEFELRSYNANSKLGLIAPYENVVKIIIAGDATIITIKVRNFTMYTVDTVLLDSIGKALFKSIPEDPGTLFVNKLVLNVLPKVSFTYVDENLVLSSLECKALIYRYKITDEDFLVTEIELEQAYTANDEQRAQIIIDRDTEARIKASVTKRAVA